MAANRCPNPNCEYFNRTLPNNAKVCPMCGTPLGPVNVVAPAPAPPSLPAPATQPPPVVDQPAYQAPTTPPAYQPPAPPPVYQSPAPSPAYQPPAPYVQPAPARPPRSARPILRLMHTSGREFCLPGEQGYIGRRSQTSRTVPEIDLTGIPNEGIVSRTHARIYWDWSQNAYMLVDNNSRNGTYLNRNPLAPNVPYRLNYSDSLQLGQNNLVCFTVSVT